MSRFSGWCSGLLFAAVVLGCGPAKELPDEVPEQKDHTGPSADPLGPAPSQSEPQARAILDRAVKAITENVPGGLEKAKTARVVYQGSIQRPESTDMTKAARTIETLWPDRAVVTDDYNGVFLTTTFFLRMNLGWLKNGPNMVPENPAEVGRILHSDLMAQHWLLLGLPLADPKGVAFAATKTPDGMTVKLTMPNTPVYRITFAEATGLPVRVEYHPVERQQRVHKIFSVSGHKPAGGLMLPTTLEYKQNNTLGERWALSSWEFPEKIDPARFDPPKQ